MLTPASWLYRVSFSLSALAVERTVTVLLTDPGRRGLVLCLIVTMLAVGAWIIFTIRRCTERLIEASAERDNRRKSAALVAAVNQSTRLHSVD